MPSRLVLLGAAQGAWCGIDTVRDPVLRISGLADGVIDFEVLTGDRTHLRGGVSSDGDYDLHNWFPPQPERFYWIRLRASSPTSSLVCLVLPKKKVA